MGLLPVPPPTLAAFLVLQAIIEDAFETLHQHMTQFPLLILEALRTEYWIRPLTSEKRTDH